MTRQQALDIMLQGKKVTHTYFVDNEYLHLVNGTITTEDGYNYTSKFYEHDYFKDGWSIYEN